MRDTFLLLWVGFLVVGVIGSIVSGIRKQAQRAQPVQQPPGRPSTKSILSGVEGLRPGIPPQWQPPQGQLPQWVQQLTAQIAPRPAPTAPRPVVPKAPPPAPIVEPPHEPAPRRHSPRLFRDRKAIVQAVIAAEVLGKPLALRDE